MPERDFLDRTIASRTERNPEFSWLLAAARRRRELFRALAQTRKTRNLTQTQVAAAMETSRSSVASLEDTRGDAKISAIDSYAAALGYVVQYHLVPAATSGDAPTVVVH